MTDTASPPESNSLGVLSSFDFGSAELVKREYRIPFIEQEIILHVVCAEDNPAYAEALLALNSARERNVVQGAFNPGSPVAKAMSDVEQEADDDRELYPGNVVKGWHGKGLVDPRTEKEIPFSVDGCTVLLKKLPRYVFNRIRTYCLMPRNFRRGNVPEKASAEKTAGN